MNPVGLAGTQAAASEFPQRARPEIPESHPISGDLAGDPSRAKGLNNEWELLRSFTLPIRNVSLQSLESKVS